MLKELILDDPQEDRIWKDVLAFLPPLPSQVKYYDEFAEKHYVLRGISEKSDFEVYYCGAPYYVRFSKFSPNMALLLKHVFVEMASREITMNTMVSRVMNTRHFTPDELVSATLSSPESVMPIWTRLVARRGTPHQLVTIKEILRLLCLYRIGGWAPSYAEFVSKSLVLPDVDKYAFLRSGRAFLSIEQEASVVSLIDDITLSVRKNPSAWNRHDLSDAAMLVCAFQFGMRPSQIARLKLEGASHRILDADGTSAVHLAFPMIKQRRGTKAPLLIRRVKPEWNQIFIELIARVPLDDASRKARVFDVSSGREAGKRISSVVRALLQDDIVSAKTLRHSAAQRMVDAGASHEELAAFLGHADVTSGLFYFQAAASHGETINRALGISEIYSTLAKVAHERFISDEELRRLKGESQIGGVPHGIPIAGIGGCASGQPACPYNPVIACYGCRRFMPLKDPNIHRQVLSDFRSVVGRFNDSGRGDSSSPAYLQLQRTIANIQSIVGELEGGYSE